MTLHWHTYHSRRRAQHIHNKQKRAQREVHGHAYEPGSDDGEGGSTEPDEARGPQLLEHIVGQRSTAPVGLKERSGRAEKEHTGINTEGYERFKKKVCESLSKQLDITNEPAVHGIAEGRGNFNNDCISMQPTDNSYVSCNFLYLISSRLGELRRFRA